MSDEAFGTSRQYFRALRDLEREGVPSKQVEILRAHFSAPAYTATTRQLATTVGYPNVGAVNIQYGKLARLVAHKLGLTKRPHGFWRFVLVDWADELGVRGETAFVLRQPVVEALARLGWARDHAMPSSETDEGADEGHLAFRLVAHRHREAALRARKLAFELRRSPDGQLRCSVPGCEFSFEEIYGLNAHRYMQVHHLKALSRRRSSFRTQLSDLALVCANCHAMIHYLNSTPPFSKLVRSRREKREV